MLLLQRKNQVNGFYLLKIFIAGNEKAMYFSRAKKRIGKRQ
jgi:hypothetical protein